jgi:hypothetical protein
VEAGATALRDADDFVRSGFISLVNRHRLGGHRHQTEADSERRCSKQFHGHFLSSDSAAARQIRIYANNTNNDVAVG